MLTWLNHNLIKSNSLAYSTAIPKHEIIEKLEIAVGQFFEFCCKGKKIWVIAEGENWVKNIYIKMGKISAYLYADRNDAV